MVFGDALWLRVDEDVAGVMLLEFSATGVTAPSVPCLPPDNVGQSDDVCGLWQKWHEVAASAPLPEPLPRGVAMGCRFGTAGEGGWRRDA